MDTGKAFRDIREEKGMSRVQVAEEIGCTPSALSKIERGKVVPKQSTIDAFCAMMRIPIAGFYFRAFSLEDFGSVEPIR